MLIRLKMIIRQSKESTEKVSRLTKKKFTNKNLSCKIKKINSGNQLL